MVDKSSHNMDRRSAIKLTGTALATTALAGCVYQAAREEGERITQAALADAAEVSVITVRSQWKQLKTILNETIDQA